MTLTDVQPTSSVLRSALLLPRLGRLPTSSIKAQPAGDLLAAGSNLMCVRDHNQLLLLHAIRTQRARTRRHLAEITGLTFQTVENISKRLIDTGIITDVGSGSGGRSRELVLRPEGAHAIGIGISSTMCEIALCDLTGRRIAAAARRLDGGAGPESLTDWLSRAVPDLMDDANVPVTTILGAGLIGDPGVEADRTGLQQRLRMPVVQAPTVVAAVRQQQWGGLMNGRDLIYVHLDAEVQCASVSHGQLCAGAQGRSGSIAHLTVDPGGSVCSCGRRGCLCTVLSEQGLREAVRRSLDLAELPALAQISGLIEGYPELAGVVNRAALCLAKALLPVVHVLDPETVILGGPTAQALGDTFIRALSRRLRDRGNQVTPTVGRAPVGPGSATSAASVILHQVFTPRVDHLLLTGG